MRNARICCTVRTRTQGRKGAKHDKNMKAGQASSAATSKMNGGIDSDVRVDELCEV